MKEAEPKGKFLGKRITCAKIFSCSLGRRRISSRRSAWRSCGLRVVSAITRPLAVFRSSSPGGLLAGSHISTGTFLAGALCLHWLSRRWV